MWRLKEEADQRPMASDLRQDVGPEPFEPTGRFLPRKTLGYVGFQPAERLHEPAGDDEPSRGSPALLIG
jgi:hypothetical protein